MAVRRKKRIRWGRVVIALFLLFGIIFVIGSSSFKYFKRDEKREVFSNKSNNKSDEEEYSLSLVMVGDNLIHDKIYNEAMKHGNGKYDFKPIYEEIKPIVSKYDLAYYNQETILGGADIGVSSYPAFNSPFEVGDAMIDAGFNLVSLATNHTLDRGTKAIMKSCEYWKDQDKVMAVGSYCSREDRDRIRIETKNNISYTMLNYTYGTNGIGVPEGQEYLVNVWPVTGNNPNNDSKYQAYKETIKKDIDAVRDRVDVLIVAMHWGIEYQERPNNYQEDMASYLASLGVDIIIGTHPHVIQPVTWLDNTLVIYSLGNFVSAHEVVNMSNRIGLMSSVTIKKSSRDGKSSISIENLDNELLYTYYTSDYKDIKVIPFSKMEDKYLSNYRDVYEKYKKIVQGLDSNISVKNIVN